MFSKVAGRGGAPVCQLGSFRHGMPSTARSRAWLTPGAGSPTCRAWTQVSTPLFCTIYVGKQGTVEAIRF